MNQAVVYLFVNAGVLAAFACLWALEFTLKAR